MSALRGCATTILPGSCGYKIIYNHGWHGGSRTAPSEVVGGAGIGVAAFVDEPRCKGVYDWITENCEILYQSPVTRNENSYRNNFLVVFKRK